APDCSTLARELGGAGLEVELGGSLRAAAVDDLDPGVGGVGFVLDDLHDGIGLATLALEVDAVAVAFALVGWTGDGGDAVGQPLGHTACVGDEVEHLLNGDADGAGVGE